LEHLGEAGTPFVFVLSPAHSAERAKLERLEAFVQAHSGMHLEVRVAPSQAKGVAGAGSHGADAWLLPLFDYLFSHQEHRAQAGLRLVREGGATLFKGVIVVRKDSGIEKLEQLSDKSIAFVDRYSTSGFVYPAKLLREANVTPKPVFAGSHEAALEQVRSGKVGAAATFMKAVEGDESLRVIAITAPIPNEPVFFRHGLDAARRDQFIGALIAFSKTPEGVEVLRDIGDIEGFEKVDDLAYQAAHDDISGADRQVQDLVPKGWWIHHQNRAPLSAYAP
jgi:phosphonate transport system substrate-binding protein